MKTLSLTNEKWNIEIVPEIGGSISLCQYEGIDVMRPASAKGLKERDVLEMSCFPLVPFSNRIRNGGFEFDGRRVQLPRNMGDHPHTIHGHGWRNPWEMLGKQTASKAEIIYHHNADEWPWSYTAEQTFEIHENSLKVCLSVVNRSRSLMPLGLGLHPYFPRTEGVTLQTRLSHVWKATKDCIPIHLVETPPEQDFSNGLKIDDVVLDDCYAGWDRNAVIRWPGRDFQLRMMGGRNLNHLVVYTPKDKDFFCVEGVENMNNAFNWMAKYGDAGAKVLHCNDSHSVVTHFKAEPVPSL